MKKINLLFIFADQWRKESTSIENPEDIITPNIEKFSRDSCYMENAFSASPLCSPNRASILTGCYPKKVGVWTNCKPGITAELVDDVDSIGDVLKKSNYKTGYIGKWHLDQPDCNKNLSSLTGAKDWDSFTPPGKKRHGFDFWYSYGAYDNHLKPHYWHDLPNFIEVNQWSVEHETNIALEFIERNKSDNFALFLSWNPPHTPLDLVPEKYLKMYEDKKFSVKKNISLTDITDHTGLITPKLNFSQEGYQDILKKYYAAITGIDENFGRIINYLKMNNLYDNTLIVLTSDHGEMLCSHGLWSKHVWFNESISVPFLMRCGNKLHVGKNSTVINGVDIMPTIISLMELSIPSGVQGKNLKEVFLKGINMKNEAIISCYPGQLSAIEKFKKEGKSNLNFGWRAIRDERYTYVVNRGYVPGVQEERFLYDNFVDKLQLNPEKIYENDTRELIKNFEKKLENWELENS